MNQDEENAAKFMDKFPGIASVCLVCGMDKHEVIAMANACYWVRTESVLVSFFEDNQPINPRWLYVKRGEYKIFYHGF